MRQIYTSMCTWRSKFCPLGLIWCLVFLGACATTAQPPNLGDLKQVVLAYHKDGRYEKDIEYVINEAREYLKRYPAESDKPLSIVLDIDETSLTNWPVIKNENRNVSNDNDFGYIKIAGDKCDDYPEAWNCWIEKATALPIKPTRDLYLEAQELKKFTVFFISARLDYEGPATQRNLNGSGFSGTYCLILRPSGPTDERYKLPDSSVTAFKNPPGCTLPVSVDTAAKTAERCKLTDSTVAAFKTAERCKLTEQGWKIVANIGDQPSDLEGGYAERIFLLPNPFYRIR